MLNLSPTRTVVIVLLMGVLMGVLGVCASRTTLAQVDRGEILDKKPLAEVDVQPLTSPQAETYVAPNVSMMFQAEEENPLSYYVRTQDGEWQIPTEVDREDPWVRLLVLGPGRPTIVDVAIEINQHSFRAAREEWIDKLLTEAQEKRSGTHVDEEEVEEAAQTAKPKETSAAAATTDNKQEETSDEDDEEDAVPEVAVQERKTSTLFKRLLNYLAADQTTVDREASREELRWLLAEWTGGPALLTLNPAFAWRRAEAAPLWHALDRNGDQKLSRGEIEQTMATYQQADSNRNDIVDLEELRRFGKEHAQHEQIQGYPLLVVIDKNTDWKILGKQLQKAYGTQTEKSDLLSLPAEVAVRVSFAKEGAKVTLLPVGDSADPNWADPNWRLNSSTENVIAVEGSAEGPGAYIELSAAQGIIDLENARGDMQQTQVAVGAVVDGFPLFRLLDNDNNHQLTQREQRETVSFLASLDRNADGQIDRRELPTPIRLAVTHGPHVHRHLANATAAQREPSKAKDAEAPAWFTGMDRNHDGDLSKREFQGSPAQFAKLDSDNDGLISRNEIQE